MRNTEKIKNITDDRTNIDLPIAAAVIGVAVLVCCLVCFGIKDPPLFEKIRDLVVTLTAVLLFVIGAALSVLFFFLSSRITDAKEKLDQVLSEADGKIEDLAEKIADILKKILEPVLEAQSRKAGIFHIFSRNKNRE